jgi:hypothetical protein
LAEHIGCLMEVMVALFEHVELLTRSRPSWA